MKWIPKKYIKFINNQEYWLFTNDKRMYQAFYSDQYKCFTYHEGYYRDEYHVSLNEVEYAMEVFEPEYPNEENTMTQRELNLEILL